MKITELLLLVVLLAVAGFAAFFFWNKKATTTTTVIERPSEPARDKTAQQIDSGIAALESVVGMFS